MQTIAFGSLVEACVAAGVVTVVAGAIGDGAGAVEVCAVAAGADDWSESAAAGAASNPATQNINTGDKRIFNPFWLLDFTL